MSDGYRKSVQDKYFSDDRGILYRRDPLKDSSGCADTPIANFTPELVEQRRIDDGFEIKDTTLFSAYRNGTHEPPVALEKKDMISNQPHAKFSPGCRIYLGRGYTASVGEMMAMQCEDAEVKTIYAHTGFVKCGDQRIFLNGDYTTKPTRIRLPSIRQLTAKPTEKSGTLTSGSTAGESAKKRRKPPPGVRDRKAAWVNNHFHFTLVKGICQWNCT